MTLTDECVHDDAIELTRWWGLYLEAQLEQQQAELALSATAVAGLRADGYSAAQIASAVGLSTERVWKMIRYSEGR